MQKKKDSLLEILFLTYLCIIIRLIIFKYPLPVLADIARMQTAGQLLCSIRSANLTLFRTIRMYIVYADRLNSFENLAGNILLFIPFGFALPQLKEEAVCFPVLLLNALVFVLAIELFEMFSGFGVFDVDDILLNCMGASLGYLGWKIIYNMI